MLPIARASDWGSRTETAGIRSSATLLRRRSRPPRLGPRHAKQRRQRIAKSSTAYLPCGPRPGLTNRLGNRGRAARSLRAPISVAAIMMNHSACCPRTIAQRVLHRVWSCSSRQQAAMMRETRSVPDIAHDRCDLVPARRLPCVHMCGLPRASLMAPAHLIKFVIRWGTGEPGSLVGGT
jgi:hypothetical protein